MQKHLYFYFPDMQNTEIIRACNLKPGDNFIILGRAYRVKVITDTEIIYAIYYGFGWLRSDLNVMGRKSQELVTRILPVTNFTNNKNTENGIYS